MARKSTLDDLLAARDRLEEHAGGPTTPSNRPPSTPTSPSKRGPGVAAWVCALLYAGFGLVSAALLGALWGVFGLACVLGSLCVGFSPRCLRDQRRVAGSLLIAGGVLIGGSWGFIAAAFGAETNTQLVVATLIIAAIVGSPPLLAGAVLVSEGTETSRPPHSP